MFAKVVGLQFVKNGVFVHCVSRDIFDDGHRVEKVYVKVDNYVYDKLSMGIECYIKYVKSGDKYYANINI